MTFRVISVANFREQRNVWKGSPVFPVGIFQWEIGHFRVPKILTFKMRPSEQPFLWKWVLFAWKWKILWKNHFYIRGWAFNLVLIRRPAGTRKWLFHFLIPANFRPSRPFFSKWSQVRIMEQRGNLRALSETWISLTLFFKVVIQWKSNSWDVCKF